MIRTFPSRDLQKLIRTQDDLIRDPDDEDDVGPSYTLVSAEATTDRAPGHDDLGVWGICTSRSMASRTGAGTSTAAATGRTTPGTGGTRTLATE